MRIIDGKPVANENSVQSVSIKPAKKRINPGIFALVIVLLAALGATYYYFVVHSTVKGLDRFTSGTSVKSIDKTTQSPTPKAMTKLKTYTGQQFHALYENYSLPNTRKVTSPPEITGLPDADSRIRELAIGRGYKLRAIPVSEISIKGMTSLGTPFLLQNKASVDWDALQKEAISTGYNLGVTSAFRSIEDQKKLFIEELNARAIDVNKIASGLYDSKIDEILKVASIPGYSRHHTGYTADFDCDKLGSFVFKTSRCYGWISKNNFENIKKHGWIPSYPDGMESQGPNPEPWEFVWVGMDVLYE